MSLLVAQEVENPLSTAKDFYLNGQFTESEQTYSNFFSRDGLSICDQALLSDLDRWATASLINRSDQALERLELVEACALDLGLDTLWAKYLIEHAEALRIMIQREAARPKLFKALSYPELSETDKAQSYAILASCYYNEKGDSTVLYANRAIEIGLRIKDTTALLESYHALAMHSRLIGRFHEAIHWSRSALNYQEGIHVRKKPETFSNIAKLFMSLKDYEKAEKYIDSTYLTVDTSLYIQFSAITDLRYGEILKNTNRLPKAKEKLQAALSKTNKASLKFKCLLHLSEIEKLLGNEQLSSKYLKDALAIGTGLEHLDTQKEIALIQSKKAIAEKKYQEAKSWAEKGLKLQQDNTSQSYTPDFYWQLAQATEKLNQTKLSLDYYKKYYAGKDSLNDLINQELVYTLENEYTAAEQDKSLFNLNTNNILQQLRLKQQRWLGIGIILFLSLLASTIFFLLRLNRKIKIQTVTIQDAVIEKNVLLKEIHHRVKNNLQVISSLFNMQSRFVKDDNALNALKESHNRVNSLALLHQNLYQEENLKGIEMPSYIDQLCDALFTASSNTNFDVRYQNNIAPLILDIDTVIPLGLIITELISAALKRKYKTGTDGMIQVELAEIENNLSLTVKDNSAIQTVAPINKNTFSQKIIDAFSKKLKASLAYNQTNGVEINMLIRRYKIRM